MPRTKQAAAPETEAPALDFNRSFQKLSWETFQKFQAAYPNKEGISLYLYRLWPLIDRKLTGQPVKNIDVFPGPVSEEDLLRKHGSGKYLLTFNDMNKPKAMCKVAETKININDHDFPPVLDQHEIIVGHRDNDSYIAGLKARGEWKRDNDMPVQNSDGTATAELARLAGKLIDKEKPPAQPDPFDQALRMLTIVKELTPKPAPIQQADPYDVALKLVGLVQGGQRAEPKEDPLEVYARVTETVERIANRFDRGGGQGGWSQVLMRVVEHLPAVVQGFVAMRVMADQGGAPPQAGVPAPVMTVPAVESPMPSTTMDLPAIFNVIRPYLFRAMTTGQSGDDFAAGLVTFVGQDKYEALSAHGEEGLMHFLKSRPDVWPMLAPYEDQVREFIGDFLRYGQPDASAAAPDGEAVQ